MQQDNTEETGGLPEIPVDPDELDQQVPVWASVASAGKEDRKWENWEYLADIKRHNDRRWLMHYGWILVGLTWTFCLLFLVALGVWTWHHLTPDHCHWLDDGRLSKIQNTLFSGGMGAVIAGVLRKQLGKV